MNYQSNEGKQSTQTPLVDVAHFFIHKRHYESPRIVRKKILAAESSKKSKKLV